MLINEENFKQIDSKLLLDPNRYREVEDMVVSIDAAATADYAKEYMLSLAEKLDAVADSMDHQLFVKYSALLKALKLSSLFSVSELEKEKFFREDLLDVLRLDFSEPQYIVELIMRFYYRSPEIINEIKKVIIRGLENNLQRLASKDIRVAGFDQPVSPTIKNWLTDYRSFVQIKPGKVTRGALEEITYANQSANVKLLSTQDREILIKLLKLYDWLLFNQFVYDFSLPGQVKEPNLELEGNEHELIPQDLADFVNKLRKAPIKSEKSAIGFSPRPAVSAVTVPKTPKPATPIPKPASAFNQKLSQVSAPVHGQPASTRGENIAYHESTRGGDLDVLKKRVEQVVLNPSPGAGAPPSPKGRGELLMTSQEIKREVSTPELATHELLEIAAPKPASTPGNNPPQSPLKLRGEGTAATKLGLKSLNNISMVDDLKKIEIGHLRQGSLVPQLQIIKSKIIGLAQANHLLPYYPVNAFEQSPLFRAYLAHGQSKFAGSPATNDLSQAEFEAIADLRKEIERL